MERKMFAKQRRHDKGKKGENDKDKDKDKDKEKAEQEGEDKKVLTTFAEKIEAMVEKKENERMAEIEVKS